MDSLESDVTACTASARRDFFVFDGLLVKIKEVPIWRAQVPKVRTEVGI